MEGRDRSQTQVDGLAVAGLKGGAAVLGHAPFGDVHVAHDLDAADDPRLDLRGELAQLVEHAVDAATDEQRLGLGLEMDVGSLHADGVGDEAVDDLDDRGIVGEGRFPGCQRLLFLALFAQLSPRVEEGGESLFEGALGADDRTHLALRAQPDLVESDDVERIGHRQHQGPVLVERERQHASPDDDVARQEGERVGREVHPAEVGNLEVQLRRQGLDEVRLRDEALADEHISQSPPVDLLAGESGLDLVLGDQAVGDEQSAEPTTACRDHRQSWYRLACLHATLTFLSPRR